MIVADTSVWINHFRVTDLTLSKALDDDEVLMHPFVLGELALGSLRQREATIANFASYERMPMASDEDVLTLIAKTPLYNRGIGYIDSHLIMSCLLHGTCKLLTRDRRLFQAAVELGIAG